MELNVENLKDSNDFLNILFDSITSAIFLVDQNLRVVKFNDSFSTLFYREEDKIIGKLCGNALGCIHTMEENRNCGETRNCATCSLRQSLIETFTSGVPADKLVLVRDFVINQQIITKYFHYSSRYVQFNGEKLIIVIVDDITEREDKDRLLRFNLEQLEDTNKQKNLLLGIAAHDLRNPLAIINTYSGILMENLAKMKTENIQEAFRIIHNSSKFSLQLLNDLLDYTKIESGTLELRKIRLNYIRFMKDIIRQNELFSSQKNIKIIPQFAQEELFMEFDPHRMEQVMNNLIGNAIKFSFPEGEITISIRKTNQEIETTVRDNGQGIPKEDVPHLFEPFRQVSVKPTHKEKGSGLGLAIVKKIIDFHQGRIQVESEPGLGSTFAFYLSA